MVVVNRKDVTCDTVARISHVMDWQAVAMQIHTNQYKFI